MIKYLIVGIFLVITWPIFANSISVITDNGYYQIITDSRFKKGVKVENRGSVQREYLIFGPLKNESQAITSEDEKKKMDDINKSKGQIGVGFNFHSLLSGLSLKYAITNTVTAQSVIWSFRNDNTKHETFSGRILYYVTDRLPLNPLISMYTGIGYGVNTVRYASNLESNKNNSLAEIFLGIEIQAAAFRNDTNRPIVLTYNTFNMLGLILGSFDNVYFTFELNYQHYVENSYTKYSGIGASMGVNIYF